MNIRFIIVIIKSLKKMYFTMYMDYCIIQGIDQNFQMPYLVNYLIFLWLPIFKNSWI